MIYKRNLLVNSIWNKSIESVIKQRLPKVKGNKIDLPDNLKGIMIFSSHAHSHDIKLLDYAIKTQFGYNQHPVFIMRDDLKLGMFPSWVNIGVTKYLLKGSIPISQKSRTGLQEIMTDISEVQNQGRPLVIFPGATRTPTYANAMVPRTAKKMYSTLEENLSLTGQYFIPVGIKYDIETEINFGEIKKIDDFSKEEFGEYILEEILRLTKTKREYMDNLKITLKKIKNH